MEEFNTYFEQLLQLAVEFAPKLLLALIVLLAGWWVANWITRLVVRGLEKSTIGNQELKDFFSSIVGIGMKIPVVISVAGIVGIETPSVVGIIAAMAVIRNPWFGRGHVEDLSPEVQDICPDMGRLLTDMLLDVTGDALEGCGKASVVGMGGEVEHAQALTHSLWFGNQLRDAIKANSNVS